MGYVGLENLIKYMLIFHLEKINGAYTVKSTVFKHRDPEMVPSNDYAGTHPLWTRPLVFIDCTDPLQPHWVVEIMQKIDSYGPPYYTPDELAKFMEKKYLM